MRSGLREARSRDPVIAAPARRRARRRLARNNPTVTDRDWMLLAIERAREGIEHGQSPFGAVIVRGGEVVADAHNEVRLTSDPTAHAEITAIRAACRRLRTIDLSTCEIFTTCEPCPMCAAAIHWARLDRVVYGAAIADARAAGFNELTVPIGDLYAAGGSRVRLARVLESSCAALFDEWLARPDARPY